MKEIMRVFETRSSDETQALAADLLKLCPQAHVILLKGELGAGKTVLVKGLAREIGIKETIASPTFVLMRTIEVPEHPRFDLLCHIDLYRLAWADEQTRLAIDEMIDRNDVLTCIEWPERLGDGLAQFGNMREAAAMIECVYIDDLTRRITLTCPPKIKP